MYKEVERKSTKRSRGSAHKGATGKREYLVQWKSGGTEWVRAQDFQAHDCIRKYWSAKSEKKGEKQEQTKKKKKRKEKLKTLEVAGPQPVSTMTTRSGRTM